MVMLATTVVFAQSPQSPPSPQSPAVPVPATAPSHQVTIDTSTPALRLEWERKVAQMIRRGELKLREEQAMPQAMRQQWFDQLYKGVPVVGSDVWRSLEGGKTKSLEGSIFTGISLDPVPKLTRAEALTAIGTLAGAASPGPSLAPTLAVLPRADGTFVLVYQSRVLTATDLTLYSIDAGTGAVVASETDPGPPQ